MRRVKASSVTIVIAILSFLIGGWLVFDGSRKLVTGQYTGEDSIGLGPWASLVMAIGVHPADLAFPFVILGTVWIVNGVVLLIEGPWRYERAIATSLLTMFYLVPGTVVGLAILVLSLRERRLHPSTNVQPPLSWKS